MNYFAIPGIKTDNPMLPVLTQRHAVFAVRRMCGLLELSFNKVVSKTRKREIVQPRQAMIYVLCKNTPLSLAQIGDIFNKDHTTVIHSRDTIADLLQNYPKIQELVFVLKSVF